MGHLVALDAEGHLIYEGLLSSQDKATVDEILNTLKSEIPEIENDLKGMYGNSVLYKYNLGIFLSNLLSKYNISISERRKFWDEIKTFATTENRKRNDGKNSKTRSFYEQCFVLAQHNIKLVEKLSWRQWQDILDRVGNREDPRIFNWIEKKEEKIREDDWREFEKALHLYLKSKDTSVFSDDEIFVIYNDLYAMAIYWRITFLQFSKDFPNSAKIKSKAKRSKKYLSTCFEIKRERRCSFNNDIFKEAFDTAMR